MVRVLFFVFAMACISLTLNAQFAHSDEFNEDSLRSEWIWFNPNPAGFYDFPGTGELHMHASALNGGSDLYPGSNYNAPRIYAPADPSIDIFEVETRIQFSPSRNFQSAGIFIDSDSMPQDTHLNRIIERRWKTDQLNAVYCNAATVPFTSTTTYLRARITPDSFYFWCSPDGQVWQYLGRSPGEPVHYIGLYTIRQPWDGVTNHHSDAHFDYFRINGVVSTQDVKPELDIQVWPNPSAGHVTVKLVQQPDYPLPAVLYDIHGRAIQTWHLSELETGLDTGVPPGTYVLCIYAENGIYRRKLVVAR